jgi:hypothetical protein
MKACTAQEMHNLPVHSQIQRNHTDTPSGQTRDTERTRLEGRGSGSAFDLGLGILGVTGLVLGDEEEVLRHWA